MGVVYRAHDEQLERDVALKVFAPTRAHGRADAAEISQEALALARLNHPNIGAIYEFGSGGALIFW